VNNSYAHALAQRLDSTFDRARQLDYESELQADFAKYLCILVAGFLERSVEAIVVEHARRNTAPRFASYVEISIRRRLRGRNLTADRLCALVGDFGIGMAIDAESSEVISSVYGSRNQLAHGNNVGVTLNQVREYYRVVKSAVMDLERVML